MVFILI